MLGAASWLSAGPAPLDLDLMRVTQSLLGVKPPWAATLTSCLKFPLLWISLALACGLAAMRGGGRHAWVPALGLVAALLLDRLLRLFILVPRPFADPEGVASSSLPSTAGLLLGGLFGAVLLLRPRPAPSARLAGVLALILLLAGVMARVVMEGHWPSQMVASALLSIAVLGVLRLGISRHGGQGLKVLLEGR